MNVSKFFPFRVDLFSEGNKCAGKQTRSRKICLSCKNMAENLQCVNSFLKARYPWRLRTRKFYIIQEFRFVINSYRLVILPRTITHCA